MKNRKKSSRGKKASRAERRVKAAAAHRQPAKPAVRKLVPGQEASTGTSAVAAKERPAPGGDTADHQQAAAKILSSGGAPEPSGWATVVPLVKQALGAARSYADVWKATLGLIRMFNGPLDPEFVQGIAGQMREHADEVTKIAAALDQVAAGVSGPPEPSGDQVNAGSASPKAPAATPGSSHLARAREALRRARDKAQ